LSVLSPALQRQKDCGPAGQIGVGLKQGGQKIESPLEGRRQTGRWPVFLRRSSFEVKGISRSNLSIKNIAQLMWCIETLEVYGVNQCSDFPNSPFTKLSRINVRNEGTIPAMNWTIGNNQTACGVQTTIVTDGALNAAADVSY
jgi:hypothetical protein